MYRIFNLLLLIIFSFHLSAETKKLDIQDYEYLGYEIYKKDWLSWIATDFLLEKNILQNDPDTRGWIVDTSKKPYSVHFMGPSEEGPKIFHTVTFNEERKPDYSENTTTEKYHQEMYRARTTALKNS